LQVLAMAIDNKIDSIPIGEDEYQACSGLTRYGGKGEVCGMESAAGAKAHDHCAASVARLKSCPVTNPSPLHLCLSKLHIHLGEMLYIPPATRHNVENTGNERLEYVYVVAPAKPR
jgi:uncharacterized RmlC-like cupin family protein